MLDTFFQSDVSSQSLGKIVIDSFAAVLSSLLAQLLLKPLTGFSITFRNSLKYFSSWLFQVQGRDPSVEFTQDIVEESEDERGFDEIMANDPAPPIELPPAEIARLEEIAELVSSCLPSPLRREKLAAAIGKSISSKVCSYIKIIGAYSSFNQNPTHFFKQHFLLILKNTTDTKF